jgi:alpha-amylase
LDSVYGSRGELKALVRASHWRGMAVVADVVLNHRCATVQGATGAWNKFGEHPTWDERVITADSPDFHGRGAPSSGPLYAAAPNIDHTQRFVRNDYCDWLKVANQHTRIDNHIHIHP